MYKDEDLTHNTVYRIENINYEINIYRVEDEYYGEWICHQDKQEHELGNPVTSWEKAVCDCKVMIDAYHFKNFKG